MAKSRLCSIPGCGKPHRAKGMCNPHYEIRRLQTKIGGAKPVYRGHVRQFYHDTVLPYEGDDCLIWPYNRGKKGYAVMMQDGKSLRISRVLCTEINGPPPTPKHHAAHTCGKGRDGCVTKGHLAWKTPSENEADKKIHGTFFVPSFRKSKVDDAQVREIVALRGKMTQKAIGEKYGISGQAVSNIQRKRAACEAH